MMERRRGTDVQVLMGVLNGAQHLPAQLGSLAAQRDVEWRLTVSDDGSGDGSDTVINRFAADHPGRVERLVAPRRGACGNFLSLLAGAKEGVVALADQDDVWLRGKLSRAALMLGAVPADVPALYFARRWVWWPDTGQLQPEASGAVRPGFGNALVENIAPDARDGASGGRRLCA